MSLKDIFNNIDNHNAEVIAEFRIKIPNPKNTDFNKLLKLLNLESLTVSEKKEICNLFCISPSNLTKEISKHIHIQEIIKELDAFPENEYEFIKCYITKHDIKMSYDEQFVSKSFRKHDSYIISNEDFEKMEPNVKVYIDSYDPKHFNKNELIHVLYKMRSELKLDFKDTDIDRALTKFIIDEKRKLKGKKIASLVYMKQKVNEKKWDDLTAAITDENQEETKIVLKHFIWQVKRKMFNFDVVYHLMPVLFGRQGSGKSTFISKFTKPIEDFVANTDFASVTDTRSHTLWENFVLVLDEMARAQRSDIDEIKNKITSNFITSRLMYSNSDTKFKNCSTFIGSTNLDLSTIITDQTGMRRFFQINCKDILDYDVLENINFADLWKSVNENDDCPLTKYSNIYNSICKIQNTKRNISVVEAFILDYGNTSKIKANELWESFKHYCITNAPSDLNKYNITKFGKEIHNVPINNKNIKITKNRTSNGIVYNIEIL